MKQPPCHLDEFLTRCQAIGLLPWVTSNPREPLRLLEHGTPRAAPFETTAVRVAVNTAWQNLQDEKSAEIVEALPHCWLLPITKHTKISGRTQAAVVALGREAAQAGWFNEACREAGLSIGDAISALADAMRYAADQLGPIQQLMTWCFADQRQEAHDRRAIGEFSEKLVQSYEETQVLFRLARLLNLQGQPLELMSAFANQILDVMPFSWIAIAFGGDLRTIEKLRTRLLVSGELPCPRNQFAKAVIRWIEQGDDDGWTQFLHPDSHPLAKLVGSEIAVEPVSHDGQRIGALIAGGKTGDDAELSSCEAQFLDAAGDFLGVFHENLARFAEQKAMFLGTIHALSSSIDAKDPYTCGHSERVAYLSAELARATGMSEAEVERVRISGLLHDVGKIGVPEAVLSKNGRPTAEEYELIKQHPVIGHEILKDIPPLADTLPGVLYHHERYDGRGYPEGICGDNIPLFGRLICVADTFDAMSSARPYRAALPRDKVLAEVRNCAGKQFDPVFAELFVELDFAKYDQMLARHNAGNRNNAAA